MFNSGHPFITLLREKLNLTNYFNPVCKVNIDEVVTKGLSLLASDRDKLWGNKGLNSNVGLLWTIANTKIRDVLSKQGRESVVFFILQRTITKISELSPRQLDQLARYIKPEKLEKIKLALGFNLAGRQQATLATQFFINGVSKPLEKCTSKEIRMSRAGHDPIKDYKFGLNLEPMEALNWGFKLTKLTSVRHRASILRVAHGDIYTKVRLKRFGLADRDECPRCDETETLTHKIYECPYTSRIWDEVALQLRQTMSQDKAKNIMGAGANESLANLTIKAEVLNRILQLKDEYTFLIHPKKFVKLAIEAVGKKETKRELKEEINDLLN